MSTAALVILAIVGGIASAIQGQFMGIMDERVGSKESVFITYAVGGVLIALIIMASRGVHLSSWQSLPWYTFTAGFLGLLIVGTVGYTVPRLGMAKAFTVIVASQLLTALLFDQFGLFGAAVRTLTLSRLIGLIFTILGVWLVLGH
jgi:bacterial/archaeal transporter family-2 protein